MRKRWALPLALLLLASCQPAGRYPMVPPARSGDAAEKKQPMPPADYAWIDTRQGYEIPIIFVTEADRPKEWQALKDYWNYAPAGGPRTAHFGLSPLGAAAAIRLSAELDGVRIKVPLGLPDPTPYIPRDNPPTLNAWALGRELFHDPRLLPVGEFTSRSCAECHDPRHGFTVAQPTPANCSTNPPSLLNAVYNKYQFWDGRGTHLEQVIQRDLADERVPARTPTDEKHPDYRHAWSGVIARLTNSPHYKARFAAVYGTFPTQDNVARSLATYMRTLLSGNSLYDRADAERRREGAKGLDVEHFRAVIDPAALKALGTDKTRTDVANLLTRGQALFLGKARCAACHPGPLFTDHDFHNIGIGVSVSLENLNPGSATGRFAVAPPGGKARRLIGAFKTPTLRSLPRTDPYMHNGGFGRIDEVIAYYNRGTTVENRWLAAPFRDGPFRNSPLGLDDGEREALDLFLRALDGDPLPAVVTDPNLRP